MREREIACEFYQAEHQCTKGKDAEFHGMCQHCGLYRKLPGGKPARTDNRKRKLAKIDKKEMRRWE